MLAINGRIQAEEAAVPAKSASVPKFEKNDRVVLLGGTFIERMQAHGYFESLLLSAKSELQLEVRNLGWSGDTVHGISRAVFGSPNDGFARLEKDVRAAKPNVLIVHYGSNEAFEGEGGLADFRRGLARLLDSLQNTGARQIIVLSPFRMRKLAPPLPDPATYNEKLPTYCAILREMAAQRNMPYVDLLDLLEANSSDAPTAEELTDNGLHLSETGYWYVAPRLATRLGVEMDSWGGKLDLQAGKMEAKGVQLSGLRSSEKGWHWEAALRQLDYPLSPISKRPHPMIPAATLTIAGLPVGSYDLLANNQPAASADAAQWREGVELTAPLGNAAWKKLQALVHRKNELYFHRYRPQNETYLFLFRKHEQGNNAVEIPQFDPLVEEAERQIHGAAQPPKQVMQLRRADESS